MTNKPSIGSRIKRRSEENMKINWKVRLRHPMFYTALAGLVGFILTDAEVLDAGKYETYVELLFGVLVAGGFITDLTTPGISDSERALTYDVPGRSTKEE